MGGDKYLDIIIVTSEPFPEGGAATNRIRSYCKGLSELGHTINVIVLKPSSMYVNKREGSIDGYQYRYATILTEWSTINLWKKLVKFIVGIYKASLFIIRYARKNKTNIILLISNNPIHILNYFLVSKFLGINYFQEKSEFPFVLNNRTLIGKCYAFLYTNILYKLFDGFIVMTESLLNYLRTKSKVSAKFFHMPMTVEMERFNNNFDAILDDEYIAYVGSMGGNKDGVDILIKSFSIVSHEFPDIKLLLIGGGPETDLLRLKNLANNLNLQNKVIFLGIIERKLIPQYLCNAKILTLSRPRSLQSTGGFPTKLGEYLSTGKPVVVTSVGEITNYLVDNESAYIAKPDDPKNFAEKIITALNDYEKAKIIGNRGREIAASNFNYKVQSLRLEKFIKQES